MEGIEERYKGLLIDSEGIDAIVSKVKVNVVEKAKKALEKRKSIEEKEKERYITDRAFKYLEEFWKRLQASRREKFLSEMEGYLNDLGKPEFDISSDGTTIEVKVNGTLRDIRHLSGGEKTILALAFIFALASNKSGSTKGNIFIDEGFSALDSTHRKEFFEIVSTLQNLSYTPFIITHMGEVVNELDEGAEAIVYKVENGVYSLQVQGYGGYIEEEGEGEGKLPPIPSSL